MSNVFKRGISVSLIELRNVSLTDNDQIILQNISFAVNAGQHTSISGPSGSGKSTILRMMALLMEPSEGQIFYQGQDVSLLDSTDYRREVSYSYQSPQLFGKTVRDNLAFPAKIRGLEFDEPRAKALLEDVGLGYITLDKKVDDLSGGEKQRTALIRNLMYPPKVLLLDEVTSGLDDDNSERIWEWLLKRASAQQVTLIWVSHNEKEQQLAEQQIHIRRGQLVESEAI